MENIAEYVEQTVKRVCAVFDDSVEFAPDEIPAEYVIYKITERGADYGEGRSFASDYLVMLNVFVKKEKYDYPLYARIKAVMQDAGFSFEGGGSVPDDRIFPFVKHYSLDFCYTG